MFPLEIIAVEGLMVNTIYWISLCLCNMKTMQEKGHKSKELIIIYLL